MAAKILLSMDAQTARRSPRCVCCTISTSPFVGSMKRKVANVGAAALFAEHWRSIFASLVSLETLHLRSPVGDVTDVHVLYPLVRHAPRMRNLHVQLPFLMADCESHAHCRHAQCPRRLVAVTHSLPHLPSRGQLCCRLPLGWRQAR